MLRLCVFALFAVSLIAQNERLKPQPNENPNLLLVDGVGSVPLTFIKGKDQVLPEVTVTDIQDGLGGTVEAKKLSAVWDEKRSARKDIEGRAILTIRTLEPLPALVDRKITLWFQWPDKHEAFTFNVTTVVKQVAGRLSIAGSPQLAIRDGRGEAVFTFTKAAQAPKPQIQLRGIREGATILPADRFDATWDSFPENAPAGPASLRVALTNKTDPALPIFGTATGEIVFKWPDGVAAPIPFTVANDSTRSFSITPASLTADTGWTQPETIRILVQNTGNVPITSLHYTAADLQDSSGRRLRIPSHSVRVEPILKNRSATLDIKLPDSTWAGTYTGSLQITADDSQEKSFGITVRSRGPQPCRWPVPLLLFVLTLGLGYWIGTQLDRWFEGGGAERNRLLLRLNDIADDLRGLRTRLAQESMPNTLRAVDDQIARVQSSPSTIPALTELVSNSDKLIDNLKQLVRNLDWIRANRVHAMADAQKQLDALSPMAADHQSKSTAILNALPQLSGGAAEGRLNRQDDPLPSAVALNKERARNTLLAELATVFAVFVIAYATVFLNKPDYGRLIDYLQTILYGLGLSTTGAKIIQKAKSSPVKV